MRREGTDVDKPRAAGVKTGLRRTSRRPVLSPRPPTRRTGAGFQMTLSCRGVLHRQRQRREPIRQALCGYSFTLAAAAPSRPPALLASKISLAESHRLRPVSPLRRYQVFFILPDFERGRVGKCGCWHVRLQLGRRVCSYRSSLSAMHSR